MKKCKKCREEKGSDFFYKNKRNKDGLYPICKTCHNKYVREYFIKNPSKLKERQEKSFITHRLKRGISLDRARKGHRSVHGHINIHGYRILISHKNIGHPCCNDSKGRMFEHRFVMYNHIGRPLKKDENVHHKNGIRHDNRIENLELWTKKHPPGRRVEDVIQWCIEFLEEYGYKVEKMD